MDTPGGGGLLSSPADLFGRCGSGQDSAASTGPSQRQSPWPLGPSPRTTDPQLGAERSDSGSAGPSTVAVSGGVPTATAFSPRIDPDGQFPASRAAASFYGAETDTSPPRLVPNNDYRPTSGTVYIHNSMCSYNVVADNICLYHTFSCCCVRNLRNTEKFAENSNLYSSRSSKIIDLGASRKRICTFLLATNIYIFISPTGSTSKQEKNQQSIKSSNNSK